MKSLRNTIIDKKICQLEIFMQVFYIKTLVLTFYLF